MASSEPQNQSNSKESQEVQPNFSLGTNELLPAIAQDAKTKDVLMLAWMNREAFEESRRTGYATYYSRSRGRLWRKGEESGHRQKIVSICIDCDADTILLEVEQIGAACHEGYPTCFFRKYSDPKSDPIDWSITTWQNRLVDPAEVYSKIKDRKS